MKPNKLYVVRIFNDKRLPDRFYDEYFFTEREQQLFYVWMKEQGWDVAKREEERE